MSSSSKTKLYNRIAAVRAKRKLERIELAHMLGIPLDTLGYIELGTYTPDLALALRISEALGQPIEHIFSLRPFDPATDSLLT